MNKLLKILILVSVVLVSGGFSSQGIWIIHPESSLSIHGTTNINTFKCMFGSYNRKDTLEYLSDGNTIQMKVTRNRMRIPVKSFDCGNRQITKDFLQTLKSDTHPDLEIRFRSFSNGSVRDNTHIDGDVEIILAGVKKQYEVRYLVKVPDKNTILLKGVQPVNFSDFCLEPPQKMMGLIQVQECLDVEFNLKLRAL